MATLANVARARKQQLRQVMLASRKLDAVQESLEREVKRLLVRKRAIPELSDAERLIGLAQGVDRSLGNMAGILLSVARDWGTQY